MTDDIVREKKAFQLLSDAADIFHYLGVYAKTGKGRKAAKKALKHVINARKQLMNI